MKIKICLLIVFHFLSFNPAFGLSPSSQFEKNLALSERAAIAVRSLTHGTKATDIIAETTAIQGILKNIDTFLLDNRSADNVPTNVTSFINTFEKYAIRLNALIENGRQSKKKIISPSTARNWEQELHSLQVELTFILGQLYSTRLEFYIHHEELENIAKLIRSSIFILSNRYRFVQGKYSLNNVDLHQFLTHFNDFPGKTHHFDLHYSPSESFIIKGNNMALFNLFDNLLTNAKKHGKASKIDIYLVNEGPRIIVSIQDNGTGIPKDFLKLVNGRVQLFRLNVTGGEGTGLGTAEVFYTMKDHHGYVNVENFSGKTTFQLIFPTLQAHSSSTSSKISSSV